MNDSVKDILEGLRYCTVATISQDGSPSSVPVHFAYDEQYIYFRSPVGTRHGLNIIRDERVSVVIFDTSQAIKGAVYVHSTATKLTGDDQAVAADMLNERFSGPARQWDAVEYFRVNIGELDAARSVAKMYYFQG